MPFQSDAITDSQLRRLSKALRKAHQEVVGAPMALNQAQEVLARTFGYAHWHEAIQAAPRRSSEVPLKPLDMSVYLKDQYARLVHNAGLNDDAMLRRVAEAALAQGELLWAGGLNALACLPVGARAQGLKSQIGSSESPDFLMLSPPPMLESDKLPMSDQGPLPKMSLSEVEFIWANMGAAETWWTTGDRQTPMGINDQHRRVVPMRTTLARYAPRLGILFRAATHQPGPSLDGPSPATRCPDAWRAYALRIVKSSIAAAIQLQRG